MKKSDFYYDLPKEYIAQTPIEPRDASKMMVINRKTDVIEDKHFYDIVDYLNEGDCLILNNTKVLPARMYGVKKDTGAVVEFLLLNQKENDVWEVITGPGKKAREGSHFSFGEGVLEADVIGVLDNGNRLAKFSYEGNNIFNAFDKVGEMPLPHYITEKLEDKDRYQTVYAKELGSAAAPTAGLHFTDEILEKIKNKGVKIGYVTLHVGPKRTANGLFRLALQAAERSKALQPSGAKSPRLKAGQISLFIPVMNSNALTACLPISTYPKVRL